MFCPPAYYLPNKQDNITVGWPDAARVKSFDALTRELTNDLEAKRLDDLRRLASLRQPELEHTVALAYAVRAGLSEFRKPFVDSFPTNGPTLHLLLTQEGWSQGEVVWAKVVEQIYSEAVEPDSKAMDRFLRLTKYSDGFYSEMIASYLSKLFKDHPEAVIDEWSVIQPYRKTCTDWLEGSFNPKNAKVARDRYRHLLRKDDPRLRQILEILKKVDVEN